MEFEVSGINLDIEYMTGQKTVVAVDLSGNPWGCINVFEEVKVCALSSFRFKLRKQLIQELKNVFSGCIGSLNESTY